MFFSTYSPLVPEDTDNWNDVYERYGGATTLISKGPASTERSLLPVLLRQLRGWNEGLLRHRRGAHERRTPTPAWTSTARARRLAGFPRPKGATPTRLSLVPAYGQCTSPNRIHGPPDFPGNGSNPDGSCNPPALDSGILTIGSPDANTKAANSTSDVRFRVVAGAAGTAGGLQRDLEIIVNDVFCRATNAACPGGALSDFTGKLLVSARIRLTDKYNGSPLVESATTQDFDLEIPVQCVATADRRRWQLLDQLRRSTHPAGRGARHGKRAIWSIGSVKVLDPGPNGTGFGAGCPTTCGDGDETVFMRPGVFVP